MSLTLQPIRVATSFDEDGIMILDAEQRLVAVLVGLADDNEVAPAQWHLEAGFGQFDGVNHPTFADLDAAEECITQRIAGRS
jgi:hypothetical protein